MTTTRDGVLVCWVSVNHHAEPLIEALSHPRSELTERVGTLILCYRQAPPSDRGAERERDAVRATVRDLRAKLDPVCPTIHRRAWKTTASPTDHAAIREFAEPTLRQVRRDHPTAPIYIHISPGTPAMHAVWLVLATTGFIGDPVHLVQGTRQRDRGANDPPVSRVDFPLQTWLRQYRRQRPSRVGDIDDGKLWEPAAIRSAPMRRLLVEIERVAPLRVPVLLLGERGTGKTTLAGLLRSRSPYQKAETWPVVVCGQFRVNPQLARSELFGHAKGAFTGATGARKGLLELGSGDTVFLDEVGDLDRDTQRLLMAAVEGRGFTRLGEHTIRQSRFRLVSATNRPLDELCGDLLDPDFFDRIATFILRVPPLRACREDLPTLWPGVLQRAVRLAEVEPEGWRDLATDVDLLRGLGHHALPGNFRDLQRVAFHVLASLAAGQDRPSSVRDALASLDRVGAPGATAPAWDRLPVDLDAELKRLEAACLRAALDQAGDNKSQAADLVGLKRKTFADRLRRAEAGETSPADGGPAPKQEPG